MADSVPSEQCPRCHRPMPDAGAAEWLTIEHDGATHHVCPDCNSAAGAEMAVEGSFAMLARQAALLTENAADLWPDDPLAAEFRETAERLRRNARAMDEAGAALAQEEDGDPPQRRLD